MKRKKLIIAGGIVVVVVALVGFNASNKPVAATNIGGYEGGALVPVEYVIEEDIEAKIASSGTLEAVDTKTIYLDTGNKINVLHKQVGDQVSQGEVIITLDREAEIKYKNEIDALQKELEAEKVALNQIQGKGSTEEILNTKATIAELENSKKTSQQDVEEAKNKLESLKNDLQSKQDKLVSNTELLDVGAISQVEIDDLDDDIEALERDIETQESKIVVSQESLSTIDAKITAAQYKLDVLENKVTDSSKAKEVAAKQSAIKKIENQIADSKNNLVKSTTQITAPISGIITYLPEGEGMTVAAGEKVLTIVDLKQMKVECDVSPYYSADLSVGLDAVIKYTGSKTIEVPGKVSKIAPIAEVEKTTNGESVKLPIEISVSEPNEIIKPGFTVDVKIITEARKDVCTVPILAIQEEDDQSYVYVVHEEGTLEKREVTQGVSNGLNIEVSNVQPGEMIVSVAEDYLTDGMKVSYEKIGDVE